MNQSCSLTNTAYSTTQYVYRGCETESTASVQWLLLSGKEDETTADEGRTVTFNLDDVRNLQLKLNKPKYLQVKNLS